MKLEQHVDKIVNIILKSLDKKFFTLGFVENMIVPVDKSVFQNEDFAGYERITNLINSFTDSGLDYSTARKELIGELTFTLFNRIAALKAMEAKSLNPTIITKEIDYSNHSFEHYAWLESNSGKSDLPKEGLREFITDKFKSLGDEIFLFSPQYQFDFIPDVYELDDIINAFNEVDFDEWKSDDILGWLYESYNKSEKQAFKDSKSKIEWNYVSLTSQVYTPSWVVKFLTDNSLGKLWMEMYPDSNLKNECKIANLNSTPNQGNQTSTPNPFSYEEKGNKSDSSPLHLWRGVGGEVVPEVLIKKVAEIKLIDPAPGSGNFLLYAFDLFYKMYIEEGYDEDVIPNLILENNLFGIDIDDRAVQIAQLGLYIKAKTYNRRFKVTKFNIISSNFHLPEFDKVEELFVSDSLAESKTLIKSVWNDLRNAHKFGSLLNFDSLLNDKIIESKSTSTLNVFEDYEVKVYSNLRNEFFDTLKKAVADNSKSSSNSFLAVETINSISFLEIISQKYDVAVANPPYTDSGNYGTELKKFVEDNYKIPLNFYSNLYVCFIKRCADFLNGQGKLGIIHPMTFMYIKSFEQVREYILNNLHISLFVEYGLSNLFGSIMADPAFYILEKNIKDNTNSIFISLDQYTRTPEEKFKKEYCLNALDDIANNQPNKHVFSLPQSKLKLIKSFPFIYWISDEFREKFKEKALEEVFYPVQGAATTNNCKFLRLWWELKREEISNNYIKDKKKWVGYSKGGAYSKWYGNNWLCLNWFNDGEDLKKSGAVLRNSRFYFKKGVTYSASGSKGTSYRILPLNNIFDTGGSCIFADNDFSNYEYLIAFLNSKLTSYMISSLNPTVNTQVGDMERVPFVMPLSTQESKVSNLAKQCVEIKKYLCEFSLIEMNFKGSPIEPNNRNQRGIGIEGSLSPKEMVNSYFNYENILLAKVLLNEAIINEEIFEVYALSDTDKKMVLDKEGVPVGSLPLMQQAKKAYIEVINEIQLTHNIEDSESGTKYKLADAITLSYIMNLPEEEPEHEKLKGIINNFERLYQKNNDLEEFCKTNQINPVNVWYLFKYSHIVPEQRAKDLGMEFLSVMIREMLDEDNDGIIPLVKSTGENTLQQRVESRFTEIGFTEAQYSQFREILGKDVHEYLEENFFKDLTEHLNLFMYLPKTPFIWHISSGDRKGFEAFISIYKWSKDSLYSLKSMYLNKRETALRNRLNEMREDNSAKAQTEKELIDYQLDEIKSMGTKIEDLLKDGYNPKLDDGVGKNIAPLQKKNLLKYKVLKDDKKDSELDKYLKADW